MCDVIFPSCAHPLDRVRIGFHAKKDIARNMWITGGKLFSHHESHYSKNSINMKVLAFTLAAISALALGYHHLQSKNSSDLSEFQAAVANRQSRRNLKTTPARFYAMGDTPYSQTEKDNLPLQLALLDPTAEFTVHLGDMQDR